MAAACGQKEAAKLFSAPPRLVGNDDFRFSDASGALTTRSVTDLFESSFDEGFALITDLIDSGHGLDDAGGWSCEGKLTVRHLTLIQGERAVSQNDETAIGEIASVVFVEIENDFFVVELGIAYLHGFSG